MDTDEHGEGRHAKYPRLAEYASFLGTLGKPSFDGLATIGCLLVIFWSMCTSFWGLETNSLTILLQLLMIALFCGILLVAYGIGHQRWIRQGLDTCQLVSEIEKGMLEHKSTVRRSLFRYLFNVPWSANRYLYGRLRGVLGKHTPNIEFLRYIREYADVYYTGRNGGVIPLLLAVIAIIPMMLIGWIDLEVMGEPGFLQFSQWFAAYTWAIWIFCFYALFSIRERITHTELQRYFDSFLTEDHA